MPMVVAAVGNALITYALPATVAHIGAAMVAYSTLIGYTLTIGASIAYSSSQNSKLRNAMKGLTDTGRNVMARDPLAVQRKIYGQIPTSGPIPFMHTTGTKNEYLHILMVIASHECQEQGTVYFENQDGLEAVPLDGSGTNGGGAATGKYAGYFFCNKYLGTPTQTADATLVAAAPTKWTANHRLRGHTYIYLQFKYNADLYPNGVPTVRVMTKGAKVLDPRVGITLKTCDMVAGNTHVGCDTTGLSVGMLVVGSGVLPGTRVLSIDGSGTFFTTNVAPFLTNTTADLALGVDAWSANWALCVADYMADPRFGKSIPWSRLTYSTLGAEANISDESVVTDSGSEARYTINGIVTADSDALPDLCAAGGGRVIDVGGTWMIIAGAYRAAGTGFTDADLVGPISVQPRQSMRESYAGVRGTYIAEANAWQPADFPPHKNDTYTAQDGNRRRWKDVAYAFTTSAPTAQRLAKLDVERGRQQVVVQALYRIKALQVQCCDTITITRSVLGWAAKEFEVIKWALKLVPGAKGGMNLAVAITARETASGVYTWANGEETTVDAAPNTTLPDPWTVAAPGALTLTHNVAYVNGDGTVIPRLRVQWPTPNNIYVESGGKIEVEYKEDGTATWIPWALNRGDTLEDYIIGVKVGLLYNVRVRFINQLLVASAWTSATSSAIVGDVTTPTAPGGFTAVAYPGYILLEWDPSTTNQVNEYLIYRSINAGAFALFATTLLTQFNDPDVSVPNNYTYKLRAVTASEVQSADSLTVGPISALNPAVGAAVPSAPTAPASTASGTYDASDGSVFAYHSIDVAALPANAIWQNLLYRRDGATDWLIAAQVKNSSGISIRLDDLSPGLTYNIGMQAWSAAGGSAVVTGSNIVAPTKTTVPADLSSVVPHTPSSSYPVSLTFHGTTRNYSSLITFDQSTSKDAVEYEFGINVNAGDDPSEAGGFTFAKVAAGQGVVQYNTISLVAQYLWSRVKNASGVWSAWVDSGYNMNGYVAIPAGDLTQQDSTDVNVTAIKTGSGSVNDVKIRAPYIAGITLAGGAPTETYNLNITGWGFSAAPDFGWFQAADLSSCEVRYDWDDSTSTTAVLRIRMLDGTNLPTSAIITGELGDY